MAPSRVTQRLTPSAKSRDFSLKVPSMSVDLMLPAAETITLVFEGIGDNKIRVNSSSLDQLKQRYKCYEVATAFHMRMTNTNA